jgi:hypothetical protein
VQVRVGGRARARQEKWSMVSGGIDFLWRDFFRDSCFIKQEAWWRSRLGMILGGGGDNSNA